MFPFVIPKQFPEMNFGWFALDFVLVDLNYYNKNTTNWVAYKQQAYFLQFLEAVKYKITMVVIGEWQGPVSLFDDCVLTVTSQGGRHD